MIDNIKQIEKLSKLPDIILLYGEDDYSLDESLDYLIKKIVPQVSEQYDIDSLNANDIPLHNALDVCKSFPFVSEKRTVIIKNFDKYFSGKQSKKTMEKSPAAQYFLNPSEKTFLILTADVDSLNGLSKMLMSSKNQDKAFKTIKNAKFPFNIILDKYEWIEFPKVWESSFPSWIKNRLKSKGKTISDSAVEVLISHSNPNLRDLSNELDKLLLYIMERKEITYDDAISVVGTSRVFNVFELQKAVGKRDLYNSLNILKNMLNVDRCEMLVLSILTRYFIALSKLMEEPPVNDQNKYQIAPKIGVSAFFIYDYVNSIKLFGQSRIDNAFIHLEEADNLLKTSSGDSMNILQNCFLKIME